MLDGTFDGDPRKLDNPDLPANDPRNGQHRQAALMVLDVYAAEKQAQAARETVSDSSEAWQKLRGEVEKLKSQVNMSELEMAAQQLVIPDDARQLVQAIDTTAETITDLRRHIASAQLTDPAEVGRREQRDGDLRRIIAALQAAQVAAQQLLRGVASSQALHDELYGALRQASRQFNEWRV